MSRRSFQRAPDPHKAPLVSAATRRDMFGTMGAMLLLTAAEAGPAKAAELDGELLHACADFAQSDRLLLASFTDPAISHEAGVTLTEHRDHLVMLIADLPARTPEGLRAKATAARCAMHTDLPEMLEDTFADCAQAWHRLLDSLCQDVTGRAGA